MSDKGVVEAMCIHSRATLALRGSRVLHLILPLTLSLLTFTWANAEEGGYIKARGKPGDAGVFINGQYMGPASRFTVPEKYPAPGGDVEVTFRDPRYEDYTTKVTVRPKKTTKLHYSLKAVEPPKGPFGRFRLGGGEPESFVSIAAGDTGAVYLNDKFFGYVDELNNPGGGILLNPGTYDLHVVSSIFGDIRQKITIEANKVSVVPLQKKENK
jgi:hypothetical protein